MNRKKIMIDFLRMLNVASVYRKRAGNKQMGSETNALNTPEEIKKRLLLHITG